MDRLTHEQESNRRDNQNNAHSAQLFEKKIFLSARELSIYLNTKESHIRHLIFREKMPYYRIGRLIRFNVNEVLQFLRNRVTED